MKTSTLLSIALTLLAAPIFADTETQLTIVDVTGGNSVTFDVDDLGLITCSESAAGLCAGLTATASGPHGTLNVQGTLGQFSINATGVGGIDSVSPTLQNLNQIEASSTGAGQLITYFTDTAASSVLNPTYEALGAQFVLAVSTVNNVQISASTTDFNFYATPGYALPATGVIGSLTGLTGLSDSDATIAANPAGASASLTTQTIMNFSGIGAIQANATISSVGSEVPEPTSVALFGTAALIAGFVYRRKLARP
jgi:hypothetical protein